MVRIFINYRNGRHAGYAALLDYVLSARFGAEAVFRDKRSVAPGDDFVITILANLRRCAVVLAIIGPGWPDGGPSTDSPGPRDWVVAELAEAFAAGIRVVPVLVDGARLPVPAVLPAEIGVLGRCQAMALRAESVNADLEVIVTRVGHLLGG
jgi:TIR domain